MGAGLPTDQHLAELQRQITECRVCADFAKDFAKPPAMNRGSGAKVMVVGQGPGKVELRKQLAFSGQSGKRLEKWLIACGAPEEDPRRGVYFTSVTKCFTSDASKIPRMAHHCSRFLQRQLDIIRPRLVISLGAEAYKRLAVDATPPAEAWGRMFHSKTALPLMPVEDQYQLLAWPHPSGANRWLNNPDNQKQLERSFELVKPFLENA